VNNSFLLLIDDSRSCGQHSLLEFMCYHISLDTCFFLRILVLSKGCMTFWSPYDILCGTVCWYLNSISRNLISQFQREETQLFVLRVMVGLVILYDHVHPQGAFVKASNVDVSMYVWSTESLPFAYTVKPWFKVCLGDRLLLPLMGVLENNV
jgi:hypothetical protein